MIMNNDERLLTIKEAKRLLGVETLTLQRWDKQGFIKVVRTPGNRRRIPLSEVLRIMTGQSSIIHAQNISIQDIQPEETNGRTSGMVSQL